MSASDTNPPDPEATEKLLTSLAQQVAQQSRTTALHIVQHDDIEATAQERANAVIDRLRFDLQQAHEAALSRAMEAMTASNNRDLHQNLTNIAARFNESLQELIGHHARILQEHVDGLETLARQSAERHGQEVEELRAEIRTSRDQAQEHRREMDQAHAARLAAVDNTLRQERNEQEQRYQQVCSDTTAEIKRLLDSALEKNARETERKLEETGAAMAQQSGDIHNAMTASNARWRRLAIILIGATVTSTALAAAALLMALL